MIFREMISDNCFIIFQKCHLTTVGSLVNSSAINYKTKLTCHNFTIYDLIWNPVHCTKEMEFQIKIVPNCFMLIIYNP